MATLKRLLREWFCQRRLPWLLAFGAVLLMLPALSAGLFMDDLAQRVIELKPEDLPQQIQRTGLGFADNGRLSTVICDLFGVSRREEALARHKDFGLLPWWLAEDVKAALWRPLTALTHWVDYRLFPNRPWLMHAHSIGWFAAAVYLVTLVYRRIHEHAFRPDSVHAAGTLWIPGVAAMLFLLDKDSYFPVMFVANRGFIMALFFGLLCLYEHHLWRTTRSGWHLVGSMAALGLSMLANEGGASTLAFLISYALVLEPPAWPPRILSLLPAAVVIATWRVVYVSMGFGVENVGGYIDPGYEPLLFMRHLGQRLFALLGGQLSGVSPELAIVFKPTWAWRLNGAFVAMAVACSLAFVPIVRTDRVARFWFVAMILALVPAATVVPLSKNMTFIAVGAFGVIAAFLAAAFTRDTRLLPAGRSRWILRLMAGVLLIAHVPGALSARAVLAVVTPLIEPASRRICGFPRFPDLGDRDVVLVNNHCLLAVMATPYVRAYYSQPVPASIRSLLPANTGFRLTRLSERSLLAETGETTASQNLLGCDDLGPAHLCYAIQGMNNILPSKLAWEKGDRVLRKGFATEVLETSPKGEPRKVAFHFDQDPESPQMLWLRFDWATRKYQRFDMPRIGQSVAIPGPRIASRGG